MPAAKSAMCTPDIGSLDRHRTQLDALRQNIATAPAGGFSPRVHRKIVRPRPAPPVACACRSALRACHPLRPLPPPEPLCERERPWDATRFHVGREPPAQRRRRQGGETPMKPSVLRARGRRRDEEMASRALRGASERKRGGRGPGGLRIPEPSLPLAGGAHEDSAGRGLHAVAAPGPQRRGGGLISAARQPAPHQVDNGGCRARSAQRGAGRSLHTASVSGLPLRVRVRQRVCALKKPTRVWQDFGKPPAASKMDVDNQLSHAYILVENMLAGETALEDFVSSGASQHWPNSIFCDLLCDITDARVS